ncbi:MAG TPA: M12 family metallo-peptidase, partial [Herpetosiphonaceae bacterium]|nr:M12 family metallo-peptidase [Herpetosiphonaceae bacterium]
YTAVRRESTQTGPGRFTWVGDLEGTPEGEIVLVVDSGALSAGIQDGQDFYEVRLAGDQLYWINLLNRNDTRDGLPPLVPDASASVLPAADPSLSPEGETIDVMVLYTPSAQTAAGGLAAMNALVDQAVADTNTAYANSDVAQRLRLVYKGAVSYTEQDFTNDLYALTFTAGSPQDPSGAIDSIHALRDTYHADLVSLLVNHSGGICGLGWLMSTASVSFESRGFNVVNYDCAVAPQNSFAHELGHNMGITHDKENAGDGVPSFAYSYGHQVPGQFRTVMAYVNGCASPCPRVRHFSNPNVTYNGFPTGTAANSASPAYNALSLDNTANTVASFRVAPVVATDRIYVPLMIR